MGPFLLVACALAGLAIGSVVLARVTRERKAAGRDPDPAGPPTWPEAAFALLLLAFAAAVIVAGLLPPGTPALTVGGVFAGVGALAIAGHLLRRLWARPS